mmetsp:Transcript_18351/g.31057  ORF Transcript_18351/g.31057 Transcript_18351/m.31057 type:complete len:160 (+) Transcript_18351:319-798(+)
MVLLLHLHGKSILKPAGDYYTKLFLDEEGDCYNIRQMSEAALIFDPVELSKMSDADIATVNYYRADKLDCFRYRHFDSKFKEKLRKEMPDLVREAKRDHNLGRIPESKEYKTRLQKRIRRKKPDSDTVYHGRTMLGNILNESGSGGKPVETNSLHTHLH